MRMKTSFAVLISIASLCGYAADPHKHAEAVPKNGGIVKEVDDVQYELVARPDRLTLFVEDHGKKVDTKSMSAKVTLRAGADRTEVKLAPAGENKLEVTGSFKVAPGTIAIAQVIRAGKGEQSVRFTLK